MKSLSKYFIIFIILTIPALVIAQDIINAKEANTLNKKGDITLISARPAADFAKVHAMGAINIDLLHW